MFEPTTLHLPVDATLRRSIEAFLFLEARLLDTDRLDDWLGLYAPDATYWVPLERDQADPYETCSIVYDDRALLETRVRQYRHPRAHARAPRARTVHQVGNVEIEPLDRGECRVRSTLLLVEFRLERQRLFGARVEHRLRPASGMPGEWQIVAKRVDLANSEAELDGISILM